MRTLLTRRLDRSVATGFLLTLALGFALAAGILLGVLAILVRSQPTLNHLDRSVSAWGFHHRTPLSTHGLDALTQLGNIKLVILFAVAVAALDFVRTRNRWSPLFLVVVLVGMELISTGVKDLVARTRPALVSEAAHLGPSFPSGHSATAAAFYAAAALVLGRRLGPRGRRLLAAAAVAASPSPSPDPGCSSTSTGSPMSSAGSPSGWGWFAVCAAVFGGRLLRPTAAVDTASAAAAPRPRGPRPAADH